MSQKPRGWHPEDIKAALRKRFGTLGDLSESWGFNRAAVANALIPGRRMSRVERRIAEALDVSPFLIWPDRWSPDGKPLPRRRNVSRPEPALHRQNEKAA